MTAVEELVLEDVDLMDAQWFADGPPHALFARMRKEAPVRWNAVEGYEPGGFWSITRHADVSAVSKDPARFSSYENGIFLNPDQVVPLDLTRNLLLYMDPPQHTKYRKILQTAFVPNTVAKMESDVRARITRILDAVIEQGKCDAVADIAVPVPLGVLAELMGIPDEDIDQLYHWTEKIEEAQRSSESNAAADTFMQMAGYLHQQIEKQVEAGDDSTLVMRLRNAEVDGEQLTDPEILVFFGLLVFAGNDTTRNTFASGLQVLLDHPETLKRLKDDPSLIPQAVEEILRWTSVVNYFVRTVKEDTELGGQQLKAGERVMIWYTSASRDEDVYANADTFDIDRDDNPHKAFGGGGRHFCLGAGLARLELKIVFEEVLKRLDKIEQAGDVERVLSAWANSLTKLPITFTPGTKVG